MFDVSARATRGAALVCLALAAVTLMTSAPAQAGNARETAAGEEPLRIPSGDARTTFAFPPKDALEGARPAAVYLNGRCGVTTNGCRHFREGAASFGWLVCPPANAKCPGGGASWGGTSDERRALVDAAVGDVARAYPDQVDAAAPTVLIGFSQGAWIALDLARQTPAKYTGLLLIGADVEPRADALKQAGVARLVLAAGAYDAAAGPMAKRARELAAAGVDARFVSLGAVGHVYVADAAHAGALTEALRWLAPKPSAPDAVATKS